MSIILSGAVFDVQKQTAWAHQAVPKLRGKIVSIEAKAEAGGGVYFDPLTSRIHFEEPPKASTQSTTGPKLELPLEVAADGIGGLDDQISIINRRLRRLQRVHQDHCGSDLVGPTTFLIHGPEGCGKSMLMERLSRCTWRCVQHLDQRWLATHRKDQTTALSSAFADARARQPALVLMEDIDKFLHKADALEESLRLELRKLANTRVVVAATSRSIYDVDARLRVFSAFKTKLELHPPNLRQREDIFRQVLGRGHSLNDVDMTVLAKRTHGFVGRDIYDLCGLATDHRLMPDEVASEDDAADIDACLEMQNFDAVFDQVHPTVLKETVLEVPKVRWSDIAGVDHARKLLEDITVRPFKVSTNKEIEATVHS